MSVRVPVFACGDPARGDDGAALAAVALLPPAVLATCEVVPAGALDVLLLVDLPADAPCIVVDAVVGLPPGEVWVRPLAALVGRARALLEAGRTPEPRSSHELPIDQVLALAAELRASPPAGTFVGIGGAEFGFGRTLSSEVAAGLPALAAAIEAEIARLAADGAAAGAVAAGAAPVEADATPVASGAPVAAGPAPVDAALARSVAGTWLPPASAKMVRTSGSPTGATSPGPTASRRSRETR